MRGLVSFMHKHTFAVVIGSCILFILSGCSYVYVQYVPVRIIAKIFLCVTFAGFIYGLALFFRSMAELLVAKNVRVPIPEKDKAEFLQLAERMNIKLDSGQPFRKKAGMKNIGANVFRFRPYIIIGEELYNILEDSEKMSVMAHEFAHIRLLHLLIKVGSVGVMVALLMTIQQMYPPVGLCEKSIFGMMITIGGIVGLWIVTYVCEFWADSVAVDFTQDKQSFISMLKRLEEPDDRDRDFVTHPSTNDRIAKIDNKIL